MAQTGAGAILKLLGLRLIKPHQIMFEATSDVRCGVVERKQRGRRIVFNSQFHYSDRARVTKWGGFGWKANELNGENMSRSNGETCFVQMGREVQEYVSEWLIAPCPVGGIRCGRFLREVFERQRRHWQCMQASRTTRPHAAIKVHASVQGGLSLGSSLSLRSFVRVGSSVSEAV
jgi:hypothetical protein